MGSIFTKLIESNTTIPTKKSETFSTAADNQSSVEVHVLQGERPMARDNRSLGRFHLDGIMPAPRGVPQIEVTLDIDANGVLSVTAKDKATGKENRIRIEGGSQLSKEEIEKMEADAEANAESDKKEKERVDKLNLADSTIFQTERQIKEFGDKLTDSNKSELESALEALKDVHKSGDIDQTDSKIDNLNSIWNKISTELYSQTQQSQGSEVNSEPEDVSYEEVK